MNDLQLFHSPQFGDIRVLTDENDNPVFVASDVAIALGYAKPNNAVSTHCRHATLKQGIIDSIGRPQSMNIIPESDFYRLVLKSDLPEAEKFQDWVCDEVLPTIRKHGIYAISATIEQMLSNPDFGIQLLSTLKEERTKRIEAETQNRELQTKAIFADAVATSSKSCLIGELAKVISQNGMNIGQNRLFKWLRSNGYLCRRGDSYNQPTQKAMELGLFEIKQNVVNKPDGSTLITSTTKVTGKGQIYFVNKFLEPQH